MVLLWPLATLAGRALSLAQPAATWRHWAALAANLLFLSTRCSVLLLFAAAVRLLGQQWSALHAALRQRCAPRPASPAAPAAPSDVRLLRAACCRLVDLAADTNAAFAEQSLIVVAHGFFSVRYTSQWP